MNAHREKQARAATVALYPVPVVLVTCTDDSGRPNIITLAWAGVVCSEPPQIGIAIRPGRHSHGLVEKSGQFVVNIPSEDLLEAVDICGTVSGRDVDKFARTGLTPEPALRVAPPLIGECPVNMECAVRQKLSLGSHDLFIGEVVAVHVDTAVLAEKGRIDFAKAKPFTYNQGEYWGLGNMLERHGFTRRGS
jgi:flavin reductase (DIM6/NTAB) family NADH-FMN oxidoreductase RutF